MLVFSNGNGTFQHWTTTTVSVGQSNHYEHQFVDVNGDGLADWGSNPQN